jgi:hypothetical protein
MDVDVTGKASAAQHAPIGDSARRAEGRGRMPCLVVALLAEPRRAHPEKPDVVAPVGHVAIQTTFPDRRMLVQEWAPGVRVTSVAVLVDAVLQDQFLGDGAVGIVAIGTLQFAFTDRHMSPVLEHGRLDRVALAAEF